MNRSRRLFVADAAGSAVALMLGGCGGGGDYMAPPPPSPSPTPAPASSPPPPAAALSCGATNISDNHGHTLALPAGDENSTVAMVYPITGAADHIHTVTLTPAQFALIKAKTAVTVISSVGLGHTHTVTVNCA